MVFKLERSLQFVLHRNVDGHRFLLLCAVLALLGTLTAAYPVTAIVIPATLMSAFRWKQIAIATTLGSAIGATVLVVLVHHMGWSNLYEHYPELASHPDWMRVMGWVSKFGNWALFFVAMSPLPQTPALLFFGMSRPDYAAVFLAVFAGKLLKYGAFAWLAKCFPAELGQGVSTLWRRFLSARK